MLAGRSGDANSSDNLFKIEKAKPKRVMMPLDPEARKARARAKMSRIDDILKPNPHTKAEAAGPVVVGEETRRKKRQFNAMVKEIVQGERALAQPLDARSELAGKLRAKSLVHDAEETSVATAAKSTKGVFDIWDERAAEVGAHAAHVSEFGFDDDWWQPARKKPKMFDEERTAERLKRSGRAAVEVAGPAASYHPEYEVHQEALRDAMEFYTRKADRGRQLAKRMPSFKKRPEPLIFAESESDEDDNLSSDSDDSDQHTTSTKVNLAHIPRKTKEDRKKEEKQRRHLARLAIIAQRKKENRDFNMVGSMVRDTDDTERIRTARREAREAMEEDRAPTKILKLGASHYTHRAPEVALTEDLSGSLRGIKPATSLLEDRFASFQRRNLIEVRHKTKRNSHVSKTKEFTKNAFKDAPVM
jgi:hypothetical protein